MAISVDAMRHEHVFLGADHDRNARKVWWVIALTASMMVVEIVGGSIFGSMALTADGWHMSTHAGAMLISALAYLYARSQARNPRFAFGTGKLGDLAGFASAIVLALIALVIAWESFLRLASPVTINFNEAILVAVVGLAVNIVSAVLLHDGHGHGHAHGHHHGHSHAAHGGHDDHAHGNAHHSHAQDHRHEHPHGNTHDHDHHDNGHGHGHEAAPGRGAQDNNLRSAYLHVIADALTSVLAIAALVLGKAYGWNALDPVMGIVGAVVIVRWSWSLIRITSGVLLDVQSEEGGLAREIRDHVETEGDRISDLHVWQVGPGHHAAIVALVSDKPREPAYYKQKLGAIDALSHVTVEVTPSGIVPAQAA
jgi:cation diffusion facilitator family transporter